MNRFKVKGPDELQEEVLDRDLCCACGACENLCPYIDVVKGRAVFVADCDQDQGDCHKYCPRTFLDYSWLNEKIFGGDGGDISLGNLKFINKTRAGEGEVRKESQYGGTVSALTRYLLDSGEIDRFVMTKTEEDWKPRPIIVEEPGQVLDCTKSKFTVSPTISALNRTLEEKEGRVGLVGTPCQITAARKMELIDGKGPNLNIGLFCTWAMKEDFLDYLSTIIDLEKVDKFDVPPPPAEKIQAFTSEGVTEIPLQRARRFTMPTCNFCMDMTSEFADISVGQVEGQTGWNTLIVRTEFGEEILESVRASNLIETEDLEKENLAHLKEAAANRKRRVLESMEGEDKKYVRLSEEDEKAIAEI